MAIKFERNPQLSTSNLFTALEDAITHYECLPENNPFRAYGLALYEFKQRFMDEVANGCRLEKENQQAIGFLNYLVDDLFDGSYPEGPEVIEEMVAYGFLIEHKATEDNRAQWEGIADVDLGESFFVRSDLLKGGINHE